MVALELGGIATALKLALDASPDVQQEMVGLLHDLCTGNEKCLETLQLCKVHATTSLPSGATGTRDLSGVQALVTLIKDGRVAEPARALVSGLLGDLAGCSHEVEEILEVAGTQCKLSPEELQELYKGDSDFDVEDVSACTHSTMRRVYVRSMLVEMGCVELMLAALFDITALLVKGQDAKPASNESGTAAVLNTSPCSSTHAHAS
jgi:hypothetical protein